MMRLNRFTPQSLYGGVIDSDSGAILLGSSAEDKKFREIRKSNGNLEKRVDELEKEVKLLKKKLNALSGDKS
jgi:uncharacterized protein YceH (UPF0502 family)